MGGGMMGRRFGMKEKLAVTPREKQLAAQFTMSKESEQEEEKQ